MAQRYYLYYKQTGAGNLVVGKPSGYSGFLHNPDAKRMSFVLPENQGKGQEQIGKFVQDFQRLNAGKFAISNAVTGTSSTPTPPAPKPPVGGTDPKPSPTKVITQSEKIEPKKEEKDDNSTIVILVVIAIGIYLYSNMKKGKKRR
ncbi:hypothetical protein [Leptospira santarosai]|uniref:hypothetical protein n=1 Tax=Leptospira santarosai TaxID=28183 RepID=UPI0024AF23DA|nr:hypothetical protein [Leptospira santarosai]MDI7215801.1 hypothetical protein [Leptospira santarosai]